MSRFVMARKRSARGKKGHGFKLLKVLDPLGRNVKILPCDDPWEENEDRIVLFEAPAKEVAALVCPDVWIEPEIQFWPQQSKYEVRVHSGGRPIEAAGVRLITLQGPAKKTRAGGFQVRNSDGVATQFTDEDGIARFLLHPGAVVSHVIVSPMSGHWEMLSDRPSAKLEIQCNELPFPSDGLGWWHRLLGIDSPDDTLGRGIRVGVIDTGVAAHPALQHVTPIGSCIDGDFEADRARDVDNHGTHVCGIIGARPEGNGYRGIAPDAELFVIRVFDGSRGATQQAVGNAVRMMRKKAMHLINLSLGAPERSQILSDEIFDAREAGCLCICAAGNQHGEVLWPARFDSVVAVTALGMPDEYPPGSLAAYSVPYMERHDAGDGCIFANFSCHGPEVRCCAPGVGIISTIPAPELLEQYSWAAMNGTSMAAPVVCALLAAALSRDPAYMQLPEDKRPDHALNVLLSMCERTKLEQHLQGHGLPRLPKKGSK